MNYDLHIHSKHSSDGYMDIKTILKKAEELKIDGVAITDHNEIEGSIKALEISSNYEIEVIPGTEVETDKGDILALWVKENIESHKAEEAIQEIHKKGGLAIAAHPFSSFYLGRVGVGEEAAALNFDAIEVYNSRNFSKMNKKALELARENNCPVTAGSDAHFEEEIGLCLTTCEKDLRKSIEKGKTGTLAHKKSFIQSLNSVLKRGYKKILRY